MTTIKNLAGRNLESKLAVIGVYPGRNPVPEIIIDQIVNVSSEGIKVVNTTRTGYSIIPFCWICGLALVNKEEDRMIISPPTSLPGRERFRIQREKRELQEQLESYIGEKVQVTFYVIREQPGRFIFVKETITGTLVRAKLFEFIKIANYSEIPFVSSRIILGEIKQEDRCIISPDERWVSTPFSVLDRLHIGTAPSSLSEEAMRIIRYVFFETHPLWLSKPSSNPEALLKAVLRDKSTH